MPGDLIPRLWGKEILILLGAAMISILIKGKEHKEVEKYLLSKGSEFVYYKYGLDMIYNEDENESNKVKIIKFLDLISKMVQPSYRKRISIKDALAEVKKL